jgi:acyl dehydratase
VNVTVHYEDLSVGDRWTSRARTITETDIVNFAGLTGDYDPLHVDHEFAKSTPFGRPIAHGMLGLSLLTGLGSHCPAVNTLAFVAIRDWRFLLPVFVGDTVHIVNEVIEKNQNGRRAGQVIWKRQLINQKGDVVQSGTLETLVAVRDIRPRRRDGKREESPEEPQIISLRGKRSSKTAA